MSAPFDALVGAAVCALQGLTIACLLATGRFGPMTSAAAGVLMGSLAIGSGVLLALRHCHRRFHVEFACTAPATVCAIALAVGVDDPAVLQAQVGLMVGAVLLGIAAERTQIPLEEQQEEAPDWAPAVVFHAGAWLLCVSAFAPILMMRTYPSSTPLAWMEAALFAGVGAVQAWSLVAKARALRRFCDSLKPAEPNPDETAHRLLQQAEDRLETAFASLWLLARTALACWLTAFPVA